MLTFVYMMGKLTSVLFIEFIRREIHLSSYQYNKASLNIYHPPRLGFDLPGVNLHAPPPDPVIGL